MVCIVSPRAFPFIAVGTAGGFRRLGGGGGGGALLLFALVVIVFVPFVLPLPLFASGETVLVILAAAGVMRSVSAEGSGNGYERVNIVGGFSDVGEMRAGSTDCERTGRETRCLSDETGPVSERGEDGDN